MIGPPWQLGRRSRQEAATRGAARRQRASARDGGGALRMVLEVLGGVARNRALRRVELAYGAFNSAEVATWLAMLVYAYARGGVTESGIVAAAMLVPAAVFAPVAAAIGGRFEPGRALVTGYVVQAASCAA